MGSATSCVSGFLGVDAALDDGTHGYGTAPLPSGRPIVIIGSMPHPKVTMSTSPREVQAAPGFWSCRPAPLTAKIVLIVVAVVSLVSDVLLVGEDLSKLAAGVVPSLVLITLGLVAQGWKPTAGAAIVVAGAFYCIFVDNASYAAACLGVAAGFLIALATREFILVFLGAVALWCIVLVWVQPRELALVPAYVLMICLGAVIGDFFRRALGKEDQHARDLADFEERRRQAIDEERRHLARELHDVIAHDLTIVAMHARVLDFAESPQDRATSQQAIGDSARNALLDLRRMLNALYGPGWDADVPGTEDPSVKLSAQIDDISAEMESLGVKVTLRLADTTGLPRSIELALLHTVRESTTNILKHVGHSTSVTMEVTLSARSVELLVSNTPCGNSRPIDLPQSGFGLIGMRDRISLFGGTLTAGPDSQGWTVRALIPLP